MAIDASIISQGIKPLEPIDPMAVQARVFGLRNAQQQSQLGQLEIQQRQQTITDMQSLDKAFQQPGGRDAVIASLPGHLRPKVQAQFDEMDKTHADAQEAIQKAQDLQADTFGRAAVMIREHNYDPMAAQGVISDLKLKNANNPAMLQQISHFEQGIQSNPTPDAIKASVDPFIKGSRTYSTLDTSAVSANARAAAAAKPTDATLAVDAATLGTPGETPTAKGSAAALDRLKPKPETSMQAKDVLLDGKPALANYDPKAGTYSVGGQDVTGRVKPVPPASLQVTPGALSDVKESVAGMKDGTLPPMLPGRATKEYLATMAEAHRQGYDLQGAVTDWNATQKHIATMNNAQQTRLNQSINALPDMLDKVDALAAQWKGGSFPILNKANLALAKGGAYGQQVASVANQLDAQIADVTADLGNVYMGGNSPTDHALGLAAKSLSGDWSQKVLTDMTKLARSNVQIRQNSIRNTGVAGASPNNPYAPPAAGGSVSVTDPNGGVHQFKSQADADAFKKLAGIK